MPAQFKDAIVVFTARSPERVIREGGSQSWVLNAARAKQCKWLVCTQNRHNPDHEFSDATEPHCSAFLVGKISRIVQADDSDDRWRIEISEVARISQLNVWDHGRNPVRYTTLEELGIDVSSLDFERMPEALQQAQQASSGTPGSRPPATLTIPEAKQALAATFGVKPEAVEITIRG